MRGEGDAVVFGVARIRRRAHDRGRFAKDEKAFHGAYRLAVWDFLQSLFPLRPLASLEREIRAYLRAMEGGVQYSEIRKWSTSKREREFAGLARELREEAARIRSAASR